MCRPCLAVYSVVSLLSSFCCIFFGLLCMARMWRVMTRVPRMMPVIEASMIENIMR